MDRQRMIVAHEAAWLRVCACMRACVRERSRTPGHPCSPTPGKTTVEPPIATVGRGCPRYKNLRCAA